MIWPSKTYFKTKCKQAGGFNDTENQQDKYPNIADEGFSFPYLPFTTIIYLY